MNRKRKKDTWLWAFVDSLLLMVGMFVAINAVQTLLINPPATKSAVELKAEFVLTLEWPKQAFDDIDLHLLLPNQQMINYKTKDSGIATLDRDDVGIHSDKYVTPEGLESYHEDNREIITIRAIMPGTYTVNVVVFAVNPYAFVNLEKLISPVQLPYNAKVSLKKLNPRFKDIVEVEIPLRELGDQKTAFTFNVDKDGNVSAIDKEADIPFVPMRPRGTTTE